MITSIWRSQRNTIPTAIRVGVLWRLDELVGVVQDLADALKEKAVEFDDIIKSGRTHLQERSRFA